MTTQEFNFPSSRVQQLEKLADDKKPYHSPHFPKKAMAQSMQIALGGDASIDTVPKQVANPDPGFTNPRSESEAVSVSLPSKFAFYEFKDLYITPFKGRQLAKISRAKEEQSTLHLVEAVSDVLSSTSDIPNLGFELTPPDFYFVLYWLRINSFTKTAFIHESVCNNEQHLQRIVSGELLPDSLRQGEIINKANLKTIMLDTVPNPELYVLECPNVVLRSSTMRDALEITEDPRFVEEEFRFLAQQASYIQAAPGFEKLTLNGRIAVVQDMSADDVQTIRDYDEAVSNYGIIEEIRVVCKTCGSSRTDAIKLEAHSFFP